MKAKHAAIWILGTAAISLVGAVVFMRSPAFWSLLPGDFLGAVERLFAIHTQEEENSLEFFFAWLTLLLIASVVVGAVAVAWRRRSRSSQS